MIENKEKVELVNMKQYSVLQTVYKQDNPEAFRKSLESMINQTIRPSEIVLVKDGPIPSALQSIIEDLEKKEPGLIVQVQLANNVGLGLALNEGLKVCKNELVARMDSDDISLPERCERQLEMFVLNPELDIVGCPVKEFIGTPDNVIGERNVPFDNESIHKYARRRDPFNHPTVMYRKSKVMSCGPYGDYRKNQDTALWIDMLGKGCKAANCKEYLLMFRFDENTYKKRKSWTNTKILIQLRYRAWKSGFNSFFDLVVVALVQFMMYLLPVGFQKFVYKKVLRR